MKGIALSNKRREQPYWATRPITGPYPDLALLVRDLMGWTVDSADFQTCRDVALKTGVSEVTISKMADGHRPKANTLERYAYGMQADYEMLMRAAGYVPGPFPEACARTIFEAGRRSGLTFEEWYAEYLKNE